MTHRSRALRAWAAFAALLLALAAQADALRSAEPDTIAIAWDPNRDGTIGYIVHVGTAPRSYSEHYDVGNVTSFTLSEALPDQRYYLAVSAYNAAGIESEYSAEVSAFVDVTPPDNKSMARCDAANVDDCAPVRFRASDLGAVSDIAAAGDGRLLLIENGRHVRVIAASGLLQEPAISFSDEDTELSAIVVDPAFDRTGYVFLGMTQPLRDGRAEFRVVRYRAVQNTLGEGATVVSGLSFVGGSQPRFALDAAGKIYVAMPATNADRADLYAGRILRFNIDGSVPPENPHGSPVVADGYPIPRAMAWDGDDLWMAGGDRGFDDSTMRLSFDGPAITTRMAFKAIALDVRRLGAGDAAAKSAVFIDADHTLHRMTMRGREVVTPFQAIRWFRDEKPVDVAVGPGGAVFVVVETDAGSFAVVQLTGDEAR
jgi:glucose/arabinose dehydrogenase